MHLTNLAFALQAAGFAGHIVLLYVLIARRLAKRFPCFTSFVVFEIGRTMIAFPTEIHLIHVPYFVLYWLLAPLDYFVSFAVIYEIATSVFGPLGFWARDVRKRVLAWFGAGMGFAVWLTFKVHPPARSPYQTWVIKGDLFVSIVMLELFTILIVVSSDVGLVWRHHVRNIADALAAYSLIDVLVDWGHSRFGSAPQTYRLLSDLREFAYIAALMYWIVTLWLPEPRRRRVTPELSARLFTLRNSLVRNAFFAKRVDQEDDDSENADHK